MTRGKDTSAGASAATHSHEIHEPGSDWVPLAVAPFHYFGKKGYIRTDEEMREAFQELVERNTLEPPPVPSPGEQPQHPPKIEWEVEWQGRRPAIQALGLTLYLYPNTGVLLLRNWAMREGRNVFFSAASFDAFAASKEWDQVPEDHQSTTKWFRQLANGLSQSMHRHLADCVKSGAAHIMARRNTAFAPFERVWPDQWEYFEVSSFAPIRTMDTPWYVPRTGEWWDDLVPICSATGPNGEKLYSIHIAPGAQKIAIEKESDAEISAERKCSDYLVNMMTRSPDCPPNGTITATRAKCLEVFDGLTARGFDRAYGYAKTIVGDACKWSVPGPRRKSSEQTSAVENSGAVITVLPHKIADR